MSLCTTSLTMYTDFVVKVGGLGWKANVIKFQPQPHGFGFEDWGLGLNITFFKLH